MRHEVRVAPFFPEDLEEIEPEVVSGGVHAIVPEHARTAFHGSRAIAAAGVIPLWPGVGSGWAVIDRGLPRVLVRAFLEAVRDTLPEIARGGPFHRIQADVRGDFVKGHRFVEALGFSWEGPLAAYSDKGVDYDRFSLVDRSLIRG